MTEITFHLLFNHQHIKTYTHSNTYGYWRNFIWQGASSYRNKYLIILSSHVTNITTFMRYYILQPLVSTYVSSFVLHFWAIDYHVIPIACETHMLLPAFHDRQGSSLTIFSVIFGFPPRFFPTCPPWVVWWLAPLSWPPWLKGLALWKERFWNDSCCALDTAALATAILILFVTLSIVHKVSGLCWPQFHSRLQAKSYASCDATSPSHVP